MNPLPTSLSAARRRLAIRHLPLVARIAARLSRRTGADRDELRGVGALGLCEAALHFNRDIGVPFRAFAILLVRRRMIDFLRDEARLRELRTRLQWRANGQLPRRDGQTPRAFQGDASCLSRRERRLQTAQRVARWNLVFGWSLRQIASRLGLSLSTVARLRREAALCVARETHLQESAA